MFFYAYVAIEDELNIISLFQTHN